MAKKKGPTIIIHGNVKIAPRKTAIEFVAMLGVGFNHSTGLGIDDVSTHEASDYKFVELISYSYHDGHDLIFCHDGDRADGVLYIGHWNDGFVAEPAKDE